MTDLQIEEVSSERYKLSGELDMASAPKLDEALEPVVRRNGRLVLDLGELTFVDSSGLRSFVQLAGQMNGSGPLILTNVPVGVRRLLDIVGLETLPGIEVEGDG